MNVQTMIQYFKKNNVPEHYYVINELGPGEVDGVGLINGRWATYFSERGGKRDIHYFDTEAEACRELIKSISELWEDETGNPLPEYSE